MIVRTGVRFAAGVAVLVLVMMTGCSASLQRLRMGHGVQAGRTVKLSAKEAEARAVILIDERWVGHHLSGASLITVEEVHRAVYIVREAGLDFAEMQITYEAAEKISQLEARTVLPDGTSVWLDSDAVLDAEMARTGGSGGQSYRVKTFAFPRASPGCIVEYRYMRIRPQWTLSLRHVAQFEVPARRVVFVFETMGARYRHSSRGFGRPSRVNRVTRWVARNLKPPPDISFRPPVRRLVPAVFISIARIDFEADLGRMRLFLHEDIYPSWAAIAQNLWRHVEEAIAVPPSKLARTVPRGSDESAARAVWSDVQQKVHNRPSVTLRDRPRNANEIYRSGFGTSDERALVMLAVLKASDLPARLLMAPGEWSEDVSNDFFTPDRLNDMLVHLRLDDGSDLILDPACLGCAAGELTVEHQERGALVIDARDRHARLAGFKYSTQGTPSVMTKVMQTELNPTGQPSHTELELVIRPRGLGVRRGHWTAEGSLAASIRHYFTEHPLTEAKRQEMMRKKYLDGVTGGTLTFYGLKTPGTPLRVNMERVLIGRSGFVQAGDWLLLQPRGIRSQTWMEKIEPGRRVPVHFRESPDFELEAQVKVPDGYLVVTLPDGLRVRSPVGDYALRVTQEGDVVALRERLRLKKRTIQVSSGPGGEYQDLLSFLQDVRQARRQYIVMRRGQSAEQARIPISPCRELHPRLLDQGHGAAQVVNKGNTQQKLDKLISRGTRLHEKGKMRKAIRAFKKALELDSSDDRAHASIGTTYFEIDQLDKAVVHLGRAVALNLKNDRALVYLGKAYQELGARTEARQAYECYLEVLPNGKFAEDIKLILGSM